MQKKAQRLYWGLGLHELSTPRCKLQRPEVVDVSYRLTDLGYDTRAGKGEDE
jgi:hypothetical protein